MNIKFGLRLQELIDDYGKTSFSDPSTPEPVVMASLIALYCDYNFAQLDMVVHELLPFVMLARANKSWNLPEISHDPQTRLFPFMEADDWMCEFFKTDDSFLFVWGRTWAVLKLHDMIVAHEKQANQSDERGSI